MNVMKWCEDAHPGERTVYYRGQKSPPEKVALTALKASDAGLVFLAQRRNRWGGFDYEATRVSRHVANLLGLVDGRPSLIANWKNAA